MTVTEHLHEPQEAARALAAALAAIVDDPESPVWAKIQAAGTLARVLTSLPDFDPDDEELPDDVRSRIP